MATIAYYHPREITPGSNRGSDVRVAKMLEAFQGIGFDVVVLAGKPRDRHRKLRQFRRDVQNGMTVDFVYAENSNAPIALAERSPIPANCLADYRFFAWLKSAGIPRGVFYRDIYWRFELFGNLLPRPLGMLLKPLYYLDWLVYNRYWEMLFLPSEAMNQHLPTPREPGAFKPLPPGCSIASEPRKELSRWTGKSLKLLYVGGIEPSVYDLSSLLQLVREREDLQLTLCCREAEWQKHSAYYAQHMADSVSIVHASGEGLAPHYRNAHLFLMIMPPTDYMDFSVPVKFFETIGRALPMVSMNQSQVARIIREQEIGWVIDTIAELSPLLDEISGSRELLAQRHSRLLEYREHCTWESRARTAAETLGHNRLGLS